MICQAHAKINLSLRVLGKRQDGFHEVDILMAPVELHDSLQFTPAECLSMSCSDASVPVDDSNLVMRAARIVERECGRPMNWHILLEKRIPHGAGLGGGSSDAASTLTVLNKLENLNWDRDKLLSLCAELGSDVGFFIDGVAARCVGRGEIVTPVPELQHFCAHILMLKPLFGVSTPDAYARWAALGGVRSEQREWKGVVFENDLEPPVFHKYIMLAELKQWLKGQQGVEVAMMSGSGSVVFAVLSAPEDAEKILQKARCDLDPTLWGWHGLCTGRLPS